MRSLLILAGLTQLAHAAPLTQRIIGHTYRVTTTYVAGSPPDCGSTPRGFRACPAPRTAAVTRDVKVTKDDVVVATFAHRVGDRVLQVECAELVDVPGPPPTPHRLGERIVKPLDGAPALPLVVDTKTGLPITTAAASCDSLRNAP